MPRNVEIKARVDDADRLRELAAAICDDRPTLIEQHDTFFDVAHGRLKLRRFADGTGELIHYERPDMRGPRVSTYACVSVDEPEGLAEALGAAVGIAGEVRKQRLLYLAGETRIHLDQVEGLGSFVELEVMLHPAQSVAEGRRRAEELMQRLGIATDALVEVAYVDLLAARDDFCAAQAKPTIMRTGMTDDVTIESMTTADWPAVRTILDAGIETGIATLEIEAPDWRAWDAAHLRHCRLVARSGSGAGEIMGWAALSPVSMRECYGGVAEVSVYVSPAVHARGIGRRLLQRLVTESEEHGIWTLQAGIFAENRASVALHARCGFRRVGVRERVGCLRGVWRDVVLFERRSARVGR